ncbi:hypothetical protein OAI34_05890 [Emcibacteraceae bacterium]|nr:hypothetical protein [Emcibacteraceae bacterium]
MSENKIIYITPEAEREAKWIAYKKQCKAELKEVDALINFAVESFLKEEPIDYILENINHVNQNGKADDTKFNDWVYDKNAFQNDEYAFLIFEEEIFKLGEDIFDYYDQEELDLKTDEYILEFMNRVIEKHSFEDGQALHCENYKGVYISATCTMHGQAGAFWSDFCIYKSIKDAYDSCADFIIVSHPFSGTSDAELISMFKKHVTDKYFKCET